MTTVMYVLNKYIFLARLFKLNEKAFASSFEKFNKFLLGIAFR